MSSIPSQIRTIDSFAEYNSNVANRLTRMLSGNNNVLMSVNSLQATVDTTSPLTVAVIQTGMVFKDDVFIEIDADHPVDFMDLDNYLVSGSSMTETGYYYIVLEYTYVKSRPAPVVNIKILLPSERSGYPLESLSLLSVVKVINTGSNVIDLSNPFHNFDPENTDNKRLYVKSYAGAETNIPTFENFRDQSRMAYDSETDKFWLGYENEWVEFGTGGSVINIDTTGTTVGQICYVDASGASTPAIATALDTGGDIAIKSVGLALDSSGKALTSGIAEDVPVEGAVVVTTGDLLYLSDIEAGKVTNNRTPEFYQVIGRAITSRVANKVDIIFTPKVVLSTAVVGQIQSVIDWIQDGTSGVYYHDIDISELDVYADFAVLTSFFDSGTDLQVYPADVEMMNVGDTLRIWMLTNGIDLNYIISTGGGGSIGLGGGGGGSDHSLLLNLGYVASGHTGFAAGALGGSHGNADHTSTFITGAGVTYANLLANLDIGTGATQVSQGNHSHDGLIASGTIMFFYSTIPVGWTIKNTGFNNNSMLVLGTAAGAVGGSEDARSFDPTVASASAGSHSHSISTQASHSHSYNGTTTQNSGTGRDQGGGSNDCAPHPHTHNFSGSTGNAGSHSHGGATGSNGNHNHAMSYDTYDPYYVRILVGTKD